MEAPDRFPEWFAALEARHLERFRFAEVRKALQALSSIYVERRERLAGGEALGTGGKRAAFALYYAPLHFLTVREIVRALGAQEPPPGQIVDLGAGTGSAGAAWASLCPGAQLRGVERSGWAGGEARWNFRRLGVAGRVVREGLDTARLPGAGGAVVLAWTANELDETARGLCLGRLLEAGSRGARILVVEPLSKRVSPWWPAWADAVREAGGRADEWRFRLPLPDRLRLLGKAAGLDVAGQGARSLWLRPQPLDARGPDSAIAGPGGFGYRPPTRFEP
jgi:hypothetical protein